MERLKLFSSDVVKDMHAKADESVRGAPVDISYTDSKGKTIRSNVYDANKCQSLTNLTVETKHDAVMPFGNKKYLRLYGHYMCPFVERVRMALAAKGIVNYQNC